MFWRRRKVKLCKCRTQQLDEINTNNQNWKSTSACVKIVVIWSPAICFRGAEKCSTIAFKLSTYVFSVRRISFAIFCVLFVKGVLSETGWFGELVCWAYRSGFQASFDAGRRPRLQFSCRTTFFGWFCFCCWSRRLSNWLHFCCWRFLCCCL